VIIICLGTSLKSSCKKIADHLLDLQTDVNNNVVPNLSFALGNQLVTALGSQARAYQLVSETTAPDNEGDKRFAREAAKNLDQLLKSVIYLEDVLGAIGNKTPIPSPPADAVVSNVYDLKLGPAKSIACGDKLYFDDSAPQSYIAVDNLKGRDGQTFGCHIEFGDDVVVVDPSYSVPPGFTMNIGDRKAIRLYQDNGINRTFSDGYVYIHDVAQNACKVGTSENLRFKQ
jgi:hypothetical protein